MNRKNKIIVSVVGITIVLLALLGLTYAYYLTRIQGNTNTNSISVTTADLRLVYRDGSPNIEEVNIEPSNEVYTKEFTVTNEGNVNIDYGVYLIDVINTFVRKDDIKYKMTCTTDGTLACGQVTSDTTFPSGISEIVTATIEPTKTHTYTFSFTYKDTGTDQSVDMGKVLQAKIQIYGENNKGIIVPFDSETLAYNIVNNASNNLNGTTLITDGSIESKVANEISTSTDKILATTEDEYATSYYYRGAVENNYVNFAGMCWRVVRIQGDGSVKLILEDQYTTCDDDETSETDTIKYTGAWDIPTTGGTTRTGNFGYNDTKVTNKWIADYLNPTTNSASGSMSTAFKNFQTSKLEAYKGDLKSGGWCYADDAYATSSVDLSTTQPLTESEKEAIYRSGTWNEDWYDWENGEYMYYDSYVRLYGNSTKTPTLKCNGTTMDKFGDNTTEMYVGTLTADEIVYAGGKVYNENYAYYLLNDYQIGKGLYWWALSPYSFDEIEAVAFIVDSDGSLSSDFVYNDFSFRPAVSLASSVRVTDGVGTIDDPYIVN